jgi:hypothetical protein
VKTAKEELIRKVKQLEHLQALQKRDHDLLKGDYATLQTKLRTFVEQVKTSGKGAEAVLEQTKGTGQSYHALIKHLDQHTSQKKNQSPTRSLESLDNAISEPSDADMDSDENTSQTQWTRVTNDTALVDHLMLLYFTWVHPVHMLFNERRFVSSLKAKTLTYCAPSLVNAICAMGCCFMADEQGNNGEAMVYRGRFAQHAHIELQTETEMTPVSAVTYAILFLVELSAGQARTAFSHLRLAVESLRVVDRASWSDDAFEITLFGIHTLNT